MNKATRSTIFRAIERIRSGLIGPNALVIIHNELNFIERILEDDRIYLSTTSEEKVKARERMTKYWEDKK